MSVPVMLAPCLLEDKEYMKTNPNTLGGMPYIGGFDPLLQILSYSKEEQDRIMNERMSASIAYMKCQCRDKDKSDDK